MKTYEGDKPKLHAVTSIADASKQKTNALYKYKHNLAKITYYKPILNLD
jgi:hypothetical protein